MILLLRNYMKQFIKKLHQILIPLTVFITFVLLFLKKVTLCLYPALEFRSKMTF